MTLRESMAELYQRNRERVRAQVVRAGVDPSEVEDRTAEVFTERFEAWQRAGAIPSDAETQLLRSAALRQSTSDPVNSSELLLPSPEEALIRAQDRVSVAAALAEMSPREQDVIRVVDLELRSYTEAAVALGITRTSLASRTRRIRLRLGETWLARQIPGPVEGPEHLSSVALVRLTGDGLWPSVRERMTEHVDGCLSCGARLAEVQEQRRRLRRGVVPVPLLVAEGLREAWARLRVRTWSQRVLRTVGVLVVVVLLLLVVALPRVGEPARVTSSGTEVTEVGGGVVVTPTVMPSPDGEDEQEQSQRPVGASQQTQAPLSAVVAWGSGEDLTAVAPGTTVQLPFSIAVTDDRVTEVVLRVTGSMAVTVLEAVGTCTPVVDGLVCAGVEVGVDGAAHGAVTVRVDQPGAASLPELGLFRTR